MMEPLRRLGTLVGRLIGLRTQESEVSVTVEGKWKGWFDPVRLGLATVAIVLVAVLFASAIGVCSALSFNDEGTPDSLTEGPYFVP